MSCAATRAEYLTKRQKKGGGGFSATKGGVKKFSLFCHKNQTCSKSPEMDRSKVKKFSLILSGGLFCHKNQSCSKLPEIGSKVKKCSLILGGGFSATKTKVAQNFLKWINLKSKNFPLLRRGGLFCQLVTNVIFNDAWNISLWSYVMCCNMSRVSHQKAEKRGGGAFLPQKPNLLKIAWSR